MEDELLDRTRKLTIEAKQIAGNLGTPGAIIVFGMLLNEGLNAVAGAIRDAGDIEGAIEKIADVIRAQG